jgi:hypothetical protein
MEYIRQISIQHSHPKQNLTNTKIIKAVALVLMVSLPPLLNSVKEITIV